MRAAPVVLMLLVLAGCPVAAGGDTNNGGGGTTHSSSHAATSSVPGGSSGNGSSIQGGGLSSGGVSSGTGASATSSNTSSGNQPAFVFSHSDTVLYRLDAVTLALTELGPFVWADANGNPADADAMTDIAIDGVGHIWGCSETALYQVDMPSIVARKMASLNDSFNGLTFVPSGFIDPQHEVLVGASNTGGTLYRIDTNTGAATAIGDYGAGWISSGDIVAIRGDAMYATVVQGALSFSDTLARIDPMTGQATVIGNIGTPNLWGLGYWAGTLYGFSSDGTIVSIDRTNGHGTVVHQGNGSFWGAGVTTNAKVN